MKYEHAIETLKWAISVAGDYIEGPQPAYRDIASLKEKRADLEAAIELLTERQKLESIKPPTEKICCPSRFRVERVGAKVNRPNRTHYENDSTLSINRPGRMRRDELEHPRPEPRKSWDAQRTGRADHG